MKNRISTSKKHLKYKKGIHKWLAVCFVFIISLLGTYLLLQSRAAAPTSPTATIPPAERFAMAAGCCSLLNNTDVAQRLDDVKAMGVKWVRVDFDWNSVQGGGATSWNWARYDSFVDLANARGLNVLGVLTYTPGWARPAGCGDDKCGPASAQAYATFAKAAATRYGPRGVHHWEIWNEPNLNVFWHPKPNIAAYTSILKAAYPAIKQADPDALIISGGFSPAASNGTDIAPRDFLRGMYSNGAKNALDAVGHHPYCYDAADCPNFTADWSAWSQMNDTPVSLRSIMVENGDGAKKIWGTEFGAPTTGSGAVTEAGQAKMVTDAYRRWNAFEWAGPLFWYSYRDVCTNTADRECSFGLKRYDGAVKPGYNAFKTAVANTTPVVTTKPDLVVTNITWTPASLTAGQEATFSATVKNQGDGATPAGTVHGVLFSVGGAVASWSDTNKSALAPGGSITLSANGGPDANATWKATAGNHAVEAFVDDVNRIAGEANENNNKFNKSLTVSSVTVDPSICRGNLTNADADPNNNDTIINFRDAGILFSNWGKTGDCNVGNFNANILNDGNIVNFRDAGIMFDNWTL